MVEWSTSMPWSFRNFCTFLYDSPVKYSCMAEVTICGVAFIFSKPKFTENRFPQALHLYRWMFPFMLCRTAFLTMFSESQYWHFWVLTSDIILLTATSALIDCENFMAWKCLHSTCRYLLSGHSHIHSESAFVMAYSPFPLWLRTV